MSHTNHGHRCVRSSSVAITSQCSKPFFSRVQKEFDANFDKFEIYALRNLFQLPEKVVEALKEPPPVKEHVLAGPDDLLLEIDENTLDLEMEELQTKVAKVSVSRVMSILDDGRVEFVFCSKSF